MQNQYVLRDVAPPHFRPAVQETSDEDADWPHRRWRQARMQVLYARHNVRVYRFIVRLTGEPVAGRGPRERGVPRRVAASRGASSPSLRCPPGCSRSLLATRRSRRCVAAPTSIWTTTWRRPSRTPADNPEIVAHTKDRNTIVQKYLTQLSPAHREVHRPASTITRSRSTKSRRSSGSPAATVKTRMFYARSKMADLLKQSGVSALLIRPVRSPRTIYPSVSMSMIRPDGLVPSTSPSNFRPQASQNRPTSRTPGTAPGQSAANPLSTCGEMRPGTD